MEFLQSYSASFNSYLADFVSKNRTPKSLYDPSDYILQLGGKRLRPILVLMACKYFNAEYKKALPAALAVEVFHNFTLVHDDIMDDAPLRRGHQTVHEKWDLNTGILSGDAMLILAFQLFESYEPEAFQKLVSLFSQTALEVCEGQQYDVDFEERNDVQVEEYLKMIEYKTSVLVACALKMGAIIGGASEQDANTMYDFGRYLGIAFQLQDDYLDAFGNPETFGKQVGGDILENKKTYLVIRALELASQDDKENLSRAMLTKDKSEEKVENVKGIFMRSGATETTLKAIKDFTDKAFAQLDHLTISGDSKNELKKFGRYLMQRES
ncbi:MAG: polyprenyl synthetase family protein [bacterium]